MASGKSKHNVKTLFLICNSFVFVIGWYWFACGVGSLTIVPATPKNVQQTVFGLKFVFVALWGYGAAFIENRKSLTSYATLMVTYALIGIAILVYSKPAAREASHERDDMSDDEKSFVGIILGVIWALVTAIMTCVLTMHMPKDVEIPATV
ncbi:uncharacterized protein LOC125235086 [Leguminivora glycinivorella]|uniref:uncharacterized protein LOC125235086 n=1 Tax=Leguminivora glycinivorella TaxID=1035111 RepID=UPI0020102A41|nr:uncharacterized protein LOC125235086 [Leguminivora glycinivorella]